MRTPSPDTSQPSVLHLSGELTIYRALELKQLLLAQPFAHVLDLSGATEIDTAGVQLIMLAKKTALASQRALRLVAHSAAVVKVFDLLNLAAYFDDPLLMASRADTHEDSANASSVRKPQGY